MVSQYSSTARPADWTGARNYDAVKCVVRGEERRGEVCSWRCRAGCDRTSVRLHLLLTADMESDNLQSSPPPTHRDIVKEGWLMKRGEVIKNWRPR